MNTNSLVPQAPPSVSIEYRPLNLGALLLRYSGGEGSGMRGLNLFQSSQPHKSLDKTIKRSPSESHNPAFSCHSPHSPKYIRFFIAVILSSIPILSASAHDGGFGHSRRTIFFDTTKDQFILEYRFTRSSDEALLEMIHIDANGDGELSPSEQESYFRTLAIELANHFDVKTATGTRLQPRLFGFSLQQNLVQTFRYAIETNAPEIRFIDRNFSHKPGVVKIISSTGAKAEFAQPTDLNHAEQVSLKVVRMTK